MFDMAKVGGTIKKLRLENALTQMELADRMGVSFQAVSNWERGNSMPDIEKLPQLAQIFHCSVGSLLGESPASAWVAQAAAGTAEVPSPQLLTEAAPILKPQQVQTLAEKSQQTQKGFDLSTLVQLAPFLGKESLSILFHRLNLADVTYEDISNIAPFADREMMSRLVNAFLQQGGTTSLKQIIDLAPFLARQDLNELILRAQRPDERITIEILTHLSPFTDKERIGQLVNAFLQQGGTASFDEIIGLAPFLARQDLGELILRGRRPNDKIDADALAALAPFAPKEVLDALASSLLEQHGALTIEEALNLAPFLDKERLFQLLESKGR